MLGLCAFVLIYSMHLTSYKGLLLPYLFLESPDLTSIFDLEVASGGARWVTLRVIQV